MYFGEHNPPRFHETYKEYTAEYDINSLLEISGTLPSRAQAMVLEWASLHRQELLADWELATEKKEIKKIEPLK